MSNYVDFIDGEFVAYDTTLDDIYIALIYIIFPNTHFNKSR